MDEFVLPESLDGLSAAELDALLDAARDEANTIAADVESADLDRLEELASAIETLETAKGLLAVAATEKAEKLAALSARINPAAEAADEAVETLSDDGADDADAAAVAEAEAIVEGAAAEDAAVEQAVVAAVKDPGKAVALPKPSARSVAARATKPAPTAKAGVAIVAAAGAPGVRNGHQFADLLEAVPQVVKLWSGYQGAGVSYAKDNVFNLKAPARDPRLVANGHNDQDVVNYATDESRRVNAETGETGVVAAGGWCAPPEQKYDICTLADLDGIWDVPTIGMPRGSISYFRQLDYSTVAAAIAAGEFCFTDAELTVDPPVVKPCFEIPCAVPVEATLDACGLCLRAGLLQQKAFPELIAAWLRLALIAHAHFLNARNLTQAQALMPAPVALAATFGAVSALLSAIDLAATDVRAFNGMAVGQNLEMVFPYWVPALLRSDYVRRQFDGESCYSVAEFNSALACRNVRAQYVKDMPGMSGGFGGPVPATVWPDTVEFWIYPAGAFLRGSEDIISVSTLVDSALLQTNRIQLLFIEIGTVILPACGDGRRYTVPVCPSGETAGPVDPVGAGICPTP